MFESFKSAKSIAVYVIFGFLILVFIISFGPQSGQTGCSPSGGTAAKVNGKGVSENSWRYGIIAYGGGNASGERARRAKLRERVLDSLIVREILAQTADDMGFKISDDEVRDRIVQGDILILGEKLDGKRMYFLPGEDGEAPRFAAKGLEQFARNLGLGSVERFVEEEKRELLAQKVRDLLGAAVRVSPEEVQQQYTLDASKVEIEYVAFQTAGYRSQLEPSAEEIDAYSKAKEADLKAQYDKEADRWKGRAKEVRVRDLFVKSEKPAPPPAAPDAPPAAPPAGDKPDPAKAKAEAALAQIKGGKDFATVARATNPDLKRGGDLGWRPLRGLRLGQNVADAVDKLDKGQTTEVIETPDGFHIVQLTDKREGDLAFDAVKRDLAESALIDEKAKAAAKADAEKALAAAKAGTPLDKQFPAAAQGDPPAAPGAKPRVQKGENIGRLGGYVNGIGTSKELVSELFDKLTVGDLASQPFEVSGDYFVVRLTKRDEPDMTKFQTEKAKIAAQMAREKAQGAVAAYQSHRCREAVGRGAVSFDDRLVMYNDTDEEKPKSTYVPCETLR